MTCHPDAPAHPRTSFSSRLATAAWLPVLLLAGGCVPADSDDSPATAGTPDPIAVPGGSSAREGDLPINFRALGTEPFWAAHVSEGRLRYLTPEDHDGVFVEVQRTSEEDGQVAVVTGVLNGSPIRLELRRAPCSDGMSDRVYAFTVVLNLGGERRNGCARTTDK